MTAQGTAPTPTTTTPDHSPQELDTDVAIVGCGPVGTLLAILLGQRGHRATVVEKWPSPYDQPRAVTFDHEIARILGILGIDSNDDPAIEQHDELYYWKNAERETLMEVDWNSIASSGWRVRYWFNQPDLEHRLRDIAGELPGVELRWGWEATGLAQDADHAELTVRRFDGRPGLHRGDSADVDAEAPGVLADGGADLRDTETIRARYVIGADGANSFVRDTLGLTYEDNGFFFDWLIVDVLPGRELDVGGSHWQLCDPARPTTIVPGGPGRRRWEFMILPGEDPAGMSTPEMAWKLLEPWGVGPEDAELERSAVYRFQARAVDTWREGRGLIAGDAAHLMPPFAGEGMCAGLRDSVALAWRLDLVLSGLADEDLLDSYGTERKGHVQHYIDFSMGLGRVICIADPEEAAERDRSMIAQMENHDGTPVDTDVASLGPGLWVEGTPHAGELSHQGVVEHDGRTGRFDDVVGRGWFVLGRGEDPAQALTDEQRDWLDVLSGRTIRIGEPGSGAEVIDVEGTYGRWFDALGVRYVVLRPDFYVAATARDAAELRDAVGRLLDGLHLTGKHRSGARRPATV